MLFYVQYVALTLCVPVRAGVSEKRKLNEKRKKSLGLVERARRLQSHESYLEMLVDTCVCVRKRRRERGLWKCCLLRDS